MAQRLVFAGLASLGLLAAAEPKAIAQADVEARYSQAFTECTADSMATADMIFCVQTEFERQEAKLETAFAAALKRVPAKRKAALQSAEQAWMTDAASRCDEAVAGESFGRTRAAKRGRCMLDETIRRIIMLEKPRASAAR